MTPAVPVSLLTPTAALTSLRQYKAADDVRFTQAQGASADLQQSRVTALVQEVKASSVENGHKLESIFGTCISALQQLEMHVAGMHAEATRSGPPRSAEADATRPQTMGTAVPSVTHVRTCARVCVCVSVCVAHCVLRLRACTCTPCFPLAARRWE
jgi:hypothetical protein